MNDKYCIIVGKGSLPTKVISAMKKKKINFVIAGIKSISPFFLVNSFEHFWFNLGEVETLLNSIKHNNCNKIIFAGYMKRPSLFSLKYDKLGKDLAIKYFKNIGGDNSLLSQIISIFESRGYEVVPPHTIANEILVKPKIYTKSSYTIDQQKDIKVGFGITKKIGNLDIGQSIIIQQSIVLSVEALEGTDNMIKRTKKIVFNTGSKAILIKTKKNIQTDKADLPAIGCKTIKNLYKANISGVILEAGNSIILDEEETIKLANKYNIFIVGFTKEDIDNL